jgi:hypothetical protein
MVSLFNDIKSKILDICPEIQFVQMYNSQFDDLGGEQGSLIYSFPMPCAFIKFDDDVQWRQLGSNQQIADPLYITIHLGHNLLDAQDGTLEQNLEVYTLSQKLFKGLNKYEPDGASCFIRVGHTQDDKHDNVYHFQQKYMTTYIDQEASEPQDGIIIEPPITLNLTTEFNPSPFLKQNG